MDMKGFKKYLDKTFNVALILAMVLLVAMVVIVFLNVVLRYGFNSGIRWSEEVSLVIVIWFTFIAMALGVKENLHISITLLPKKLPRIINDMLNFIKYVLEMSIGGILFYYGIKLTMNGARSKLPATGLSNAINYLVVPIAAFFIFLYAFYYLTVALKDFRRLKLQKGDLTAPTGGNQNA